METPRRSVLVYALLLAAWALLLVWQGAEHIRVRDSARAALINRAKDISTTLGIVTRSQRRFGGVVSKERLESTLTELVRPGELNSIALLNAAGEVVASAGAPLDLQSRGVPRPAEQWGPDTVTLMNLVDLGTNVTHDMEGTNPPIILSRQNFIHPPPTNRPPPPPEMEGGEGGPPPGMMADSNAPGGGMPEREHFEGGFNPSNAPGMAATNRIMHWREGRPRFNRPPWMGEEEFKAIMEKQGVHSFVIVLSTKSLREISRSDLWVRFIIALLATSSVVGLALAWRNLGKSAELQIRLVRASELNTHLKELNLAAAGLAHETRNPLNLIRGRAQLISKQTDSPPETRIQAREIIDEADRVAAQLNEFINYSRPREVRRTVLALHAVVGEVVRALNYDLEAKHIQVQTPADTLRIEADEQLLRQALFNLLFNAIQAVSDHGVIQIVAQKQNAAEALLEIRDNGPGVPPERRTEIFKPYFTTQPKGTGLGLAVVQQIVLAHGWEVECLANAPAGAVFRITHLKLA
ncbi:MAG TPA: ATP-binding protein [Dongiaceae bacterium]|jgi:signal transduction histidine kinase|nr:ATP-binding protein [Dongiaceae bacterium]